MSSNRGVAIMVIGIVSCVFFVVTALTFWPCVVISLATGIVAWVMGGEDLRGIKQGVVSKDGKGFVLSGYICGIVATILSGVALVVGVAMFAFVMLALGGMARNPWWNF